MTDGTSHRYASNNAADLRSFRYALEPLRLQRDWQLEQRRLQLARALQQWQDEERVLADLKQAHAQGSHATQHPPGAQLDPAHLARSLAYLTQLQQRMAAQAKKVEAQRVKHDQAQQAYFQAHKDQEAIDRHRELALQEHAAEGLRQQAIESDRDWLARRITAPSMALAQERKT